MTKTTSQKGEGIGESGTAPVTATVEKLFPMELLSLPVEVSKAYFHTRIFEHPHFVTASNRILQAILHPAGRNVVSLYGPAGAGKSQVLIEVQKDLDKILNREIDKDTGRLAFARLQVPPVENGKLVWRDLYFDYLRALLDDLSLDYKMDFETRGIRALGTGTNSTYIEVDKNISIHKLRGAVITGLQNRLPKAVFMDRAQNLTRIGNGTPARLGDQLDVLQYIAEQSATVHVLAGNYDLHKLVETHNTPTTDIHLPAYRLYKRADLEAFIDVLTTFEAFLPIAEELNFKYDMHYFYRGCLGCIGTLKQWVEQALAYALANAKVKRGVRVLAKPFKTYLDEALLSQSKMCEMIDAIMSEDSREIRVQDEYQTKYLGYEHGMALHPADNAPTPNLTGKDKTRKAPSKGTQPWRRKPGRDATGQHTQNTPLSA